MIAALVTTFSVLAFLGIGVALGLVIQSHVLSFIQAPSGPGNANALKMTRGTVVLVAGTITENLGINAFPANATVLYTRAVTGGAVGHLTVGWNPATGLITFTSSSGTDTSTIAYAIMA
jgi:hypothetical protein